MLPVGVCFFTIEQAGKKQIDCAISKTYILTL